MVKTSEHLNLKFVSDFVLRAWCLFLLAIKFNHTFVMANLTIRFRSINGDDIYPNIICLVLTLELVSQQN